MFARHMFAERPFGVKHPKVNRPKLSHPSEMIMAMTTNTTMRLVTLPAARQIHPLGHLPTAGPPQCVVRPRPTSFESTANAAESALVADSLVLGIRVRNASRFRRRRAVAAVVATALLLATWSLLAVLSHHLVPAAAGGPIPPTAAAAHVVQPGDTLWSIATEVVGVTDAQVRPIVDQLAARTGGAALDVGQRVPLGGLDLG